MSSIKKNVLAVALVAGLGLAGGAAAYNYGTAAFGAAATTGDTSNTAPSGIATPEDVPYEMLTASAYNWTMAEDLIFDIQIPDNAVQFTNGFTVRIALNSRCTPHDTATNPASPPTNVRTCAPTTDGAAFNTAAASRSLASCALRWSTAACPVSASNRRTPADEALSPRATKAPMSPVRATWVPPHSSSE
mgnify:CR=1 FL=1